MTLALGAGLLATNTVNAAETTPLLKVNVLDGQAVVVRGYNLGAQKPGTMTATVGTNSPAVTSLVSDSSGRFVNSFLLPTAFSGTVAITATFDTITLSKTVTVGTATSTSTSAPAPTTSTTAKPVTVSTSIEDNATGTGVNQLAYAGTWQVGTDATKSGGTDHYTHQAGASVSITFDGTSVAVYAAKDAHHGQATVAIDGGAAQTIDYYAAVRADNTLIFKSPALTNGRHTAMLTATGTKNASATDNVVTLDRVVLESDTNQSVTTTTAKPTSTTVNPATTTTAKPATTTTTTTVASGSMPAITVSGNRIMRNGQSWWFDGTDSFVWSGNCGTDAEKMNPTAVDAWFAGMRHDGHAAVRIFYFQGWSTAALDAAVASAKKYNVYLTITLDDAIGGCGANEKNPAWFANSTQVANYKSHLQTVVSHYKGETAIAWMEYFNEPGGYGVGASLANFYTQMGAVADAIDPNRLWSSGTVASYWVGGDANYRAIQASSGVDIVSVHEYDSTQVASSWALNAANNNVGKPIIIGEMGINATQSGAGCETSFDTRASRNSAKLKAYTAAPFIGAFIWAWQPGNGGTSCEYGNIDADAATQNVLRTFNP